MIIKRQVVMYQVAGDKWY